MSTDDLDAVRELVRELELALAGESRFVPWLSRVLHAFRLARVEMELARGSDGGAADTERAPASLVDAAQTDFRLTPRECDVLALVANGHSNRRIADNLGCSSRTVEVHVSRLLEKSNCDSRAELIARVWAQGLGKTG